MLLKLLFYIFKFNLICIFSVFYIIRALYQSYVRRGMPSKSIDLSTEPNCLKDPTLGKHNSIHIKKRDIEIHYVAKGDCSKPLMLFLHGFPEFWYSWRYQLRDFGEDYYAVAMDMTGYGSSSKPTDIKRYKRVELATDIKEFILELGYNTCVLVGHDWGGILSYDVAYYYPEVVEQLIVMNGPNQRGMVAGFGLTQLLRSSYCFYFQLPVLPDYFLSNDNCAVLNSILKTGPGACKNKEAISDEDLYAYKYTFLKGGFTCPLNYYRCAIDFAALEEPYGLIKVPTLIIWGTADVALGTELAALSAKYIEKCKVQYVEDASHWVQMDKHEEVNRLIRQHLLNPLK